MVYRVVYSRRGALPTSALSAVQGEGGVLRDAGPFPDRQDAINHACRLRRLLPEYSLEIWSDNERIMDHEAIKSLCDRQDCPDTKKQPAEEP